jgi:hypothetical protein
MCYYFKREGRQKMVKRDVKGILRRVRAKVKPEKVNYTFRFDKELMEDFRKSCKKQGVTATATLEEFMLAVLDELESKKGDR